MTERRAYTVHARWDEASRTWWTDGEEVPGLTCQADTLDELVDAITGMAGELLRDNVGLAPGEEVEITILAERHAFIAA